MPFFYSALLSVVLTLTSVTPGFAQVLCGERKAIIKELFEKHQEHPTHAGLVNNGNVLELVTSQEGTWTVLITTPDGTTCILATGEHWTQLKKAQKTGTGI